MAVTPNSIVTPQAKNTNVVQFTDSNGTTKQTAFTTGANGSTLKGLIVNTNNSAQRRLDLFYYNGSTAYFIGAINIPANASYTAVSVNALNTTLFPGLPRDANGNPYMDFKAGHSLQVAFDANMAAGLLANVYSIAEDY